MLWGLPLLFCFLLWVLLGAWGLCSWSFSFSGYSFLFSEADCSFIWGDVSMICCCMLVFCGLIALFFCFHYYGGDSAASGLYYMLVWFLLVMGCLVLSGSMLFTLIFWEYLGLVSFFLILYYLNGSSLRASVITLVASRVGDVSLFFLVMCVGLGYDTSLIIPSVFLLVAVLTKSACYPFVSWLLEAMRAPTPVSALVHSSTLVAAGVWFLCRYGVMFGDGALSVLFVLSLLTVFVSGLCALFFCDLKKLVALSTCNNVSWCLIFYVCGDVNLALLQLLTHGVAKCYLFITVGDLMSSSGGSQSSVGVFLSRYSGLIGVFTQLVLVFSLSGLPFLGVFFTKHELLASASYVFSLGSLLFLLLGFLVSYSYSFRLSLLLMKSTGGLSSGFVSVCLLAPILSLLSTVVSYSGVLFLCECSSIGGTVSAFVLLSQMLGCVLGYFFFVLRSGGHLLWSSLVFSDGVVKWVFERYLVWTRWCYLSFYRWEVALFEYYVSRVEHFVDCWRLSSIPSYGYVFYLILLCFCVEFVFGLWCWWSAGWHANLECWSD